MAGLRSSFSRLREVFLEVANKTQGFYERRQTLITVSATLASCLAAWWTYTSKLAHQRTLEEHLALIHADLEKHRKLQSRSSSEDLEKAKELQKQAEAPTALRFIAPGILCTFLLGYAAGYRHGKRVLLK